MIFILYLLFVTSVWENGWRYYHAVFAKRPVNKLLLYLYVFSYIQDTGRPSIYVVFEDFSFSAMQNLTLHEDIDIFQENVLEK